MASTIVLIPSIQANLVLAHLGSWRAAAALRSWREAAAELARRRGGVARCLARIRGGTQAAAFGAWVERVQRKRHCAVVLLNVMEARNDQAISPGVPHQGHPALVRWMVGGGGGSSV